MSETAALQGAVGIGALPEMLPVGADARTLRVEGLPGAKGWALLALELVGL
jgi:hypothetical protein